MHTTAPCIICEVEVIVGQVNEVGSTEQIEKSSIWMLSASRWPESGVVVSVVYHALSQRLHTR